MRGIEMKMAGMVLILVALVVGVAVRGSRALPLPGTGVAFEQCLTGVGDGSDRCAFAAIPTAGLSERRALMALDLARERLFGQGLPIEPDGRGVRSVFDPVR